jgi:hypothetical protein
MSNVQIVNSGSPVPALSLVTTDQKTILGDGTSQDPLRALASGVVEIPLGSHPNTHLGAALRASGGDSYAAAFADSLPDALLTGLCSRVLHGTLADTATEIQYTGELTLTAAEWDVVTDQSGGLTPDAAYYVSAAVGGHITTVPPVAAGSFVALVGIALSATTMLLRPSFPIGPHA